MAPNKFEIKLVKQINNKRNFNGDSLTVSFVENEKEVSNYFAGRGLGPNGKPVVEIYVDNNENKIVKIFNKDSAITNSLGNNFEIDKNGYIELNASLIETFPNSAVSIQVESNEGLISNILVRGTDILINHGKENQIQMPFEKPIDVELSSSYFKDVAEGKIHANVFPAQMFETILNANPEIEGVQAKQFKVNGENVKFLTLKTNAGNKLFTVNSTEIRQIEEIIDGSKNYEEGNQGKEFSHDLAFRFKTGNFGEKGRAGDLAAVLNDVSHANSLEILKYIDEQLGTKSFAKKVSPQTYETKIRNVPELSSKAKKQFVAEVFGKNTNSLNDDNLQNELSQLNPLKEPLNEEQESFKDDDLQKEQSKQKIEDISNQISENSNIVRQIENDRVELENKLKDEKEVEENNVEEAKDTKKTIETKEKTEKKKQDKDKKEEKEAVRTKLPGSTGRAIKYGLIGFAFGVLLISAILTALAGMLFPAFALFGLAIGTSIITSAEVVEDVKKVSKEKLKNKTKENENKAKEIEKEIEQLKSKTKNQKKDNKKDKESDKEKEQEKNNIHKQNEEEQDKDKNLEDSKQQDKDESEKEKENNKKRKKSLLENLRIQFQQTANKNKQAENKNMVYEAKAKPVVQSVELKRQQEITAKKESLQQKPKQAVSEMQRKAEQRRQQAIQARNNLLNKNNSSAQNNNQGFEQ